MLVHMICSGNQREAGKVQMELPNGAYCTVLLENMTGGGARANNWDKHRSFE